MMELNEELQKKIDSEEFKQYKGKFDRLVGEILNKLNNIKLEVRKFYEGKIESGNDLNQEMNTILSFLYELEDLHFINTLFLQPKDNPMGFYTPISTAMMQLEWLNKKEALIKIIIAKLGKDLVIIKEKWQK